MPRDPVYARYGVDITQEEYDKGYKDLNLDKSIVERYIIWAKQAVQGDFGISYKYSTEVTKVIGDKIGVTFYLSIVSMVISIPIGILLGIITAVKRGKWQDTVLTLVANVTNSVPPFIIAVVLLWVFVIQLKLLPTSGFTLPWVDFGLSVKQGILPIVCLSLGGIAGTCRQTRSSMLEAIRQDYVRTARSKGLKEGFIIYKHVMRNGLVPIITLIGGSLGMLIAGSAFIEIVFGIPGMGNLLVNSVNNVDIPIMQASVMLTALVVSMAYLLTDFLYVVVDPRISLK
jgi:peptide/nickel transport system permease protein